jgi:hypothetical protein
VYFTDCCCPPSQKKYIIRIVIEGNDDFMMAWEKEYALENREKEVYDAIKMLSTIPLPVEKDYLRKIGFEVE